MSLSIKYRILFLITDLGKGGAERFLLDLCKELQSYDNIEFKIGSLLENNQNEEYTKEFSVANLYYKPFSLFKKHEEIPYKNLLETFKPNIIHTHRFLAEFLSSYYVDKNIKYVCHAHDNMEQFNKFSLKILLNKRLFCQYIEKKHLFKYKYNNSDTYFIANSKHTESFLKNVLPKKVQNQVYIIYYGFNYEKFYFKKERSLVNGQKIKILNVGSFQAKKNQMFLVEIAEELKRRNFFFEMYLIGDGETRDEIKSEITKKGLDQCVLLPGIINNVEDWYKSCDIYLHSAYYEPFGLVFMEAMAAGLPVITLDGKGNRDIIENDRNGYLFFEQKKEVFANKIIELTMSSEKYTSISNFAKEFSARFDSKIKNRELIDFYFELLKK